MLKLLPALIQNASKHGPVLANTYVQGSSLNISRRGTGQLLQLLLERWELFVVAVKHAGPSYCWSGDNGVANGI